MRSLTSTMIAAQKQQNIPALWRIVLSKTGATTQTYTKSRILDIMQEEQPYSQRAEVLLDNHDNALTSIDFRGYKGIISYGITTSVGEEYSPTAPLWVIGQELESSRGRLVCLLQLIGIPNLLGEDRASENYIPASDNADTVKTIITAILGATLTCYSHCKAYSIVWQSEDNLIGSYQPKDSFRIYKNGTRLAAIRRLLDYTRCVMLPRHDEKLYIFIPRGTE